MAVSQVVGQASMAPSTVSSDRRGTAHMPASVPTPLASPQHYLGYRLRVLRRAAGLSVRELSAIARVDPAEIGRLERADPDAILRSVVEACDRALGADGELVELSRMILQTTTDIGAGTSGPHGVAGVGQQRPISGAARGEPPGAGVRVPRLLPAEARGFVGRGQELTKLEAAAEDEGSGLRLIVLEGTAGVGKSALAVRLAHRISARFPHGQLFINLRGYDPGPPLGPEAALERFLRALGVAPASIPTGVEERAELYRSLLADRRALVLLDNAATVGQVRPLLPGETRCLVVVTSRNRLSGLSARDGAHHLSLGLLPESEAVELMTTATEGYRSGDEPAELLQLARLCARLPLALRIAAERAAARPLMPLGDLIADLHGESSRWDALSTGEEADADAVRSVFAWSHRALPAPAARAFRLLGLHPGPEFATAAVTALLGEPVDRARGLLDLLAGAHLVEQIAPDRFQFHDLLRAYAADQACIEEDPGTRTAAVRRVVHWYLWSADAAARATQNLFPPVLTVPPDPELRLAAFPGYREAIEWYRVERANLLAVARISAEAECEQAAWQLPVTTHTLHASQHAIDDWLEMARLGLNAARHLGDRRAEALVLQLDGNAHKAAGDLDAAAARHQQADASFAALGDKVGQLEAVNSLGLIHLKRRQLQMAQERFTQVLALAGEANQRTWTGLALNNLAATHHQTGRFEYAANLAQQALAHYQACSAESRLYISPLVTLAAVRRETGDLAGADEFLQRAEAILSQVNYLSLEHAVRAERAALDRECCRLERALEGYHHCLALQRTLGDRHLEALDYDGIGLTLAAMGRAEEAADFHRTALAQASTHAADLETATILAHLADALKHGDPTDQDGATHALDEAVALLGETADPRATALRARLHSVSRST